MVRIRYMLYALLLVAAASTAGRGQEQVTEKQVELETRFIDANREQLLGNYDKAIPIYEEILKKDERNHAAAYELARIYNVREDAEKAIRYARQAAGLDPANVWYQQLLADLYQKGGRNREAAGIFEQLVRQRPDNEEYYYRWAYYLVRANDIDRALRVYDQLEARAGVTEELIRRKHALYLGSGDTRKAARELERLVEAYPSSPEYLHQLAEFYEQIGQPDKSKAAYQRIVELDPNDARARLALAGTPQMANGEIQYLQSLRPIFENGGAAIDPKVQQILPVIQRVADTGNRQLGEAALELTTILERVHPDEAKAFAASGDLLYFLGRRPEAIRKYLRTLELDETVFLVWEQLLYAYLEEERYADLKKKSQDAMDLYPNRAVVYYLSGVANDELGRHREALADLQQARLMAGNDGRLVCDIEGRLGQVYDSLGQPAEAGQAFEAALKLNPKAADVLAAYGLFLAQRGEQLDRARQMTGLANELLPNRARYQYAFGWVLYKMKEYGSAKQWIGQALQNGGDGNPRILEHYGDVLFQLDDAAGALHYWTQAQEKGGRSPLLEKKINDKQLYE